MGVTMIVCSLLMGSAVLFFDIMFPGSVVNWFSASGEQFLMMRSGILMSLGLLLAVHWFFNNRWIRRACGLISLGFFYGAYYFLFNYSVYLFDMLLLFHAGICFAIIAMQRADETEGLRPAPAPATLPLPPSRNRARLMLAQRLQVLSRLQRQTARRFSPRLYMSEIKDDSHHLTVDFPRSAHTF